LFCMTFTMVRPLILIVTLLFPMALQAFDMLTRGREIADEARHYTVLIENTTADPFVGRVAGGAGTGVIAEVDEEAGVVRIFTNKHVVDKKFLMAQELKASFFYSYEENPESVPAKLVYVSSAYDFAVVEVALEDIEHAKKHFRVANFASKEITEQSGYVGSTPVMAYGHPLLSQNIVTKGSISGYHSNFEGQRFIQTDTTINAGNSGGPLIDMESKEVIGLNTWKLVGQAVHNTNFAVPIHHLLDDYAKWKKYRSEQRLSVSFGIALVPTRAFQSPVFAEVRKILKSRYPDFERKHNGLLIAQNIFRATNPVEMGDILVAVEGKTVGKEFFLLKRLMQTAALEKDKVSVTVLRNGSFMDLEMPIETVKSPQESAFDFVSFSGLVIGEVHPNIPLMTGLKGVQVYYQHLDMEISNLTPGTVITHIKRFNGAFEPIENLADLEEKLKTLEADGVKNVALKILSMPANQEIEGDEVVEYPSREAHEYADFTALAGRPTVVIMDINDLMTSKEVSMTQILGEFDFEASSASLNLEKKVGVHAPTSRAQSVLARARHGRQACQEELLIF
jgi:S1-C subfamily serine protease